MSALYLYLIKLSVSLSVVYLFYQFVLKRLTFYNWNRFFLLCYTMGSFLIPFINVTPVLERNQMIDNGIVKFIPGVGALNTTIAANHLPVKHNAWFSWTAQEWILIVLSTGFFIMLVRLVILLLSLKRIINKAELILNEDVKIYQVNQSIIPFSFGKSIFINRGLHNEDELREIIHHEFVHVRQRHTGDIIWAELLCALNWYNPFVWLTRKAIRQNLEFIADNKVLETGIDRKQYQYLLLKVIGNNHFSIASQFNFSSLKKRIAMMNKIKSAKAHGIKFLFILPLMAILVLSFRNKMTRMPSQDPVKVFNLSGIVYDNRNESPLAGVTMIEPVTGIQTITDDNGFYKITIPITSKEKQRFTIKFSKKGYSDNDRRIELDTYADRSCLGFFSLLNENNAVDKINHAFFYSAKDKKGNTIANPGYDFVKDRFERYFKERTENESFYEKRIYSLEDIKIEELKISRADTIPGQVKTNDKGYFIDVTDNKGNCTIVVKDRSGQEVVSVLLTEWNKNKDFYEDVYGEIKSASVKNGQEVKRPFDSAYTVAMNKEGDTTFYAGLSGTVVVNDNVSGDMHIEQVTVFDRNKMFNNKITIASDSITWIAGKNQLSFRGSALLNDKVSNVEMASDRIDFKEDFPYLLINGNEIDIRKDYINAKKNVYTMMTLQKKDAVKKYGMKGKSGAIEITSRD